MARKYSYDLKIANRENVTAYLVSQYSMPTGSTFGFGLERIADGVFTSGWRHRVGKRGEKIHDRQENENDKSQENSI